MTTPRVVDYGEQALLLQIGDLDAVMAVAAALRDRLRDRDPAWRSVRDVVPAAETVLITLDDPRARTTLRRQVESLIATPSPALTPDGEAIEPVEIPVTYDGPDLEPVADLLGLTVPELIAAHTGRPWRAAFGGFAPGFTYLTGGDPRLVVPRLHEPRTSVPRGAVGLAGSFSGVYPRDTPGGWQVLGRTDVEVWDLHRTPPALIRPGVAVRFVAVT